MIIAGIIASVFLAGCFGGFVNALLAGELQSPRFDKKTNVYKPGWIGNVLIGGAAALVFWGLYGPASNVAIIGETETITVTLKIGELCGSLLTGIGGSRLLMNEIDKLALKNQNDALTSTKESLSQALMKLVAPKE